MRHAPGFFFDLGVIFEMTRDQQLKLDIEQYVKPVRRMALIIVALIIVSGLGLRLIHTSGAKAHQEAQHADPR